MSAVATVYDCEVAPAMATQFCRSPVGSQRSHWYANFVGLPDHDPFVTVSLSPTKGWVAWPWSVGLDVGAGTALLRAEPVAAAKAATAAASKSAATRGNVVRF